MLIKEVFSLGVTTQKWLGFSLHLSPNNEDVTTNRKIHEHKTIAWLKLWTIPNAVS
ncbi:hypothetical protein GCM10011364_13100 [Mangrovimonas yunxiaonensis]|nr:hypothetical protein GCM10011364_13100 [Mangrovimonas yunxiaonensis]